MRIAGGIFKGRKILTIPGLATRPTTDKVRQAIFNILINDIQGTEVLDLFAGSGALGIEAISRGAVLAVFVDNQPGPLKIIRQNLKSLGLEMDIWPLDYHQAAQKLAESKRQFHLIFADPPYEVIMPDEVIKIVCQYDLLCPGGLLIIEHRSGRLGDTTGLELLKKRKFGQTEISFLAGR